MEPITASLFTVQTAEDVEELPWQPLGSIRGVVHKVLWHDDESMAGIMRIDPGHNLGAHSHHANHHHMWIQDGSAVIGGREVGPGSYVHVPARVEHDIDATGTSGCTLLYLYIRQNPAG
jgi:mannose-6-phosphate isomerase-like protein (cupin superfamily)